MLRCSILSSNFSRLQKLEIVFERSNVSHANDIVYDQLRGSLALLTKVVSLANSRDIRCS